MSALFMGQFDPVQMNRCTKARLVFPTSMSHFSRQAYRSSKCSPLSRKAALIKIDNGETSLIQDLAWQGSSIQVQHVIAPCVWSHPFLPRTFLSLPHETTFYLSPALLSQHDQHHPVYAQIASGQISSEKKI
jgi:hypothetical protein